MSAKFGEVPVIPAEYGGISSIFLNISYSSGSKQPKFTFSERYIGDCDRGHYKEEIRGAPSITNEDAPIRVVMDICNSPPTGEKQQDHMKFLYEEGKEMSIAMHRLAREFNYMMIVIGNEDVSVQGTFKQRSQNIANTGIGKVMNPHVMKNGIRFHMGKSKDLDVRGRFDYVSTALRTFFELKGYENVRNVSVVPMKK